MISTRRFVAQPNPFLQFPTLAVLLLPFVLAACGTFENVRGGAPHASEIEPASRDRVAREAEAPAPEDGEEERSSPREPVEARDLPPVSEDADGVPASPASRPAPDRLPPSPQEGEGLVVDPPAPPPATPAEPPPGAAAPELEDIEPAREPESRLPEAEIFPDVATLPERPADLPDAAQLAEARAELEAIRDNPERAGARESRPEPSPDPEPEQAQPLAEAEGGRGVDSRLPPMDEPREVAPFDSPFPRTPVDRAINDIALRGAFAAAPRDDDVERFALLTGPSIIRSRLDSSVLPPRLQRQGTMATGVMGSSPTAAMGAFDTSSVRLNPVGSTLQPGRDFRPADASSSWLAGSVFFDHGQTGLDAPARAEVREIAAQLAGSNAFLRIVGHASSRVDGTDPIAGRLANLRVSEARAEAVAQVLAQAGVERARIMVAARGDSSDPPPLPGMTAEASARRADIFVDIR